MRAFGACVLGMLVLASVAMPGSADASRTIDATTKKVERIGDWKIGHHPTFRAAIRAFGDPNSFGSVYGPWHCRARWWTLGLRVDFANFGGQNPCRPRHGLAGSVKIKGRPAKRYGWRTWRGVRIGSTVRALRQRHPGAERRGRNWWIKTGRTHIGDCPPRGCRVPILKAIVRGGRGPRVLYGDRCGRRLTHGSAWGRVLAPQRFIVRRLLPLRARPTY